MGTRELVALLNLSSWCPVMVEWLFLSVPWGCLRFVNVVFPDHTHILLFYKLKIFTLYNNLQPHQNTLINLIGQSWSEDYKLYI